MTLEDSFGRRFSYLRLSITDVCNFKCNYCLPDGYQSHESTAPLSIKEIQNLICAFAQLGTKKIRITGGEPSVRKDLTQIIRIAKNTKGIEQVAITTNGYKLRQQIDNWVSAGLTRLNISIDSLDPRQFHAITGHNRLEDLLRGVEKAHSLGINQIKINSVLMKQHNADQLPAFLNWLKTAPVTLRFIELMQTGNNQTFFRENHIAGSSIKESLLNQGWQPVIRKTHDGPAQEFWHSDYQGKIGLIMPYSKDFCNSCNRLRVSAQGDLHLCLFGEKGHSLRHLLSNPDTQELRQRIQELVLGKKATHDLHQGNTGATSHFAMLGG